VHKRLEEKEYLVKAESRCRCIFIYNGFGGSSRGAAAFASGNFWRVNPTDGTVYLVEREQTIERAGSVHVHILQSGHGF